MKDLYFQKRLFERHCRDYMERTGATQTEFAEMVGTAPSTISHLLSGRAPSVELFLRICFLLSLNPINFLRTEKGR